MFRSLLAGIIVLAMPIHVFAQDEPADKKIELKTIEEKGSYTIGYQIGQQLKSQGLRPALNALLAGIKDALESADPRITPDEMEAGIREFSQQGAAIIKKEIEAMAAKNRQDGVKFLAENKKKKGVTTLKSGLQYEVLTTGSGPSPKATDRVKTHYHGTLIDGSVFDSSVERKMPSTFGVNMVIAGWTEALQLMKIGDKWRLFLPSELAYGVRGSQPKIGPNTTLIFEVELLGIE
jgi:FKBP-type peptidyl-prolyl cis-trans isomerase FklB